VPRTGVELGLLFDWLLRLCEGGVGDLGSIWEKVGDLSSPGRGYYRIVISKITLIFCFQKL
jgi:hypothetical protein